MASRRSKKETKTERQNRGYDEAVQQGGPPLPNDTERISYLPPEPPDVRRTRERNDIDEQQTERAIADVRRREHSAD